jgi:hypothetical protein
MYCNGVGRDLRDIFQRRNQTRGNTDCNTTAPSKAWLEHFRAFQLPTLKCSLCSFVLQRPLGEASAGDYNRGVWFCCGLGYLVSVAAANWPRFDRLRSFSAALDRRPDMMLGRPERKPIAATLLVAGGAAATALSTTGLTAWPSFVSDVDPTSLALAASWCQKSSV